MKILVPNPKIRERSTEVEPKEFDKCVKIARKMIVLCDKKHESGIGLSAIQVGIAKRFFIAKINMDEWQIFINPVIISYGKATISSAEGCLSFPGQAGLVKRSQKVRIRYFNENREEIIKMFKHGKNPIVIQHECDHCDGIVIVDKFVRKL